MAKRTIQMLVDDIDGSEADETIRFAFDGVEYEIDLTTKHAEAFRKVVTPYTAAGTKVGRSQNLSGKRPAVSNDGRVKATVDPGQAKAIRAWATARGEKVTARGRIPEHIIDLYNREAGR